MIRKISGLFIAAAAVLILWNSSAAQYGQDTSSRTQPDTTTIRRMQTDTSRVRYHSRTRDTSMQRGGYNYDTSHVRTWTPNNSNQPDTSTHY